MAGVGGRTIAEAKERISYDEFASWIEYATRHGGFNSALRAESGFAMLAAVLSRLHGNRGAAMADFLPRRPTAQADGATAQDVFRLLRATAHKTRSDVEGA